MQLIFNDLTEETNGCNSDSSPIEAIEPAVTNFVARAVAEDSNTEIAANNYGTPAIEIEVECQTMCYVKF